MPEKIIGKVTHYFDKISVAVLRLDDSLKTGDQVHFMGHGADFTQPVSSMQVEHQKIDQAKAGDDVGLEVSQKVKPGTEVMLVDSE